MDDSAAGSKAGRARVTRALARACEDHFVDAVRGRLTAGEPLADLDGRRLPPPGDPPVASDQSAQIRRLLDHRQDAAELQGTCPRGRRLTLSIRRPRLLGRGKTALVIVAASIVRLERHVDPGWDADPIGLTLLEQAVQSWALAPGVPHVLGVLSPTGWAAEVEPDRLAGDQRRVVLISPLTADGFTRPEAMAFSVRRSPGTPESYGPLFDPETREARQARAARELAADTRLLLPDGLILLEPLISEGRYSRAVVEAAVARLSADDPQMIAETVDGEWILRRRRA